MMWHRSWRLGIPLLGVVLSGCDSLPQLPNHLPPSFTGTNHAPLDDAIQSYSATIAAPNMSDSLKAEAYNSRCIAYLSKGMRDDALADCNDAIRLKPDFASAYGNRGIIYLEKAQYDLAIADMDVALGLKPDNAITLSNRGFAYLKKGKHDEAIADFGEAIRLKPDSVAYRYRGETYFDKGDPGRTIADETEAIRLNPRDSEAHDLRALSHLVQQEPDAALADINAAVELQPNAAGYYADRGIIELAMDRFSPAADDFQHALKIIPTGATIAMWLHVARRKAGTDDAAEFEHNVANLDQTKWPGPIIALYRGQIDATRLDDLTPSSGAGVCVIAFHIGEYHLLQHDPAAARPFLEKASEICPSYLPAEDVLTQVELKRIGK